MKSSEEARRKLSHDPVLDISFLEQISRNDLFMEDIGFQHFLEEPFWPGSWAPQDPGPIQKCQFGNHEKTTDKMGATQLDY